MIKNLKPIAAAAAATLALSNTANAEVDMFLEIDGIQGEVDDADFKGAIDVLAWSWGLSQSGTTHDGSGGAGGKTFVQDLSFTHYVDSSSVDLYKEVAMGKAISSATLSVRTTGVEPLVYIEILMENVIVTSASTGGSGGETKLTENVSLNFGKVTTTYTKDSKTTPVQYCFDIVNDTDC